MSEKKKKRYYAFGFMILAELLALTLFISGCILRQTVVKDMPQYDAVQTVALPMQVLKDRDKIRAEKEMAARNAARKKAREKAEAKKKKEELAKKKAKEEERKKRAAIDEHYFDNTLFIGDSKMVELAEWGPLGKAKYFCGVSYSVFNIFSEKVSNKWFKNKTLEQALSAHQYDQVYIELGYNESGYPYESLIKQYEEVLDYVRDAQPDARIVLHAVMHASKSVAEAEPAYSPKNLDKINRGIKKLAKERDRVFYVDPGKPFYDKDGYLKEGTSFDGEHLDVEHTEKWSKEILKRAVIE